jgi:hypothetical protein
MPEYFQAKARDLAMIDLLMPDKKSLHVVLRVGKVDLSVGKVAISDVKRRMQAFANGFLTGAKLLGAICTLPKSMRSKANSDSVSKTLTERRSKV